MENKQEKFTDIPDIEKSDVGKPEKEVEVELEDKDQVDIEKETTRSVSEKFVMESVGMTLEDQKKFEFDKSANLKLGGLFEEKLRDLTLSGAKRVVMENPLDFDLPKDMAKRLTDEQIKKLIGENPSLREKIASDPEFAEVVHLNETFKKAGGNLDTSEKILFFKTASKVVSQPELLKEIRVKLWESMEGVDMDEKATERLEEKYVEDRMEIYKREEIERIMIDEEDRDRVKEMVDEAIRKEVNEEMTQEGKKGLSKREQERIREEKDKRRPVLQAEAINKLISDKKDRIEKVLGRPVTDEEIIFLKKKKGKDMTEISSVRGFFREKIRWGDTEKKRLEFDQFLSGELTGMEDYFDGKAKEFEKEKLEEIKEGIIKESLNEIPVDLVQRIYRKRKAVRMANMTREKELGKDKEKISKFKKEFDRDGSHISNLIRMFGSEDNVTLEDFQRGIDGFANEDFKKYAKEQKIKQSGEKYSLLVLILKFLFGFTGTANKQK